MITPTVSVGGTEAQRVIFPQFRESKWPSRMESLILQLPSCSGPGRRPARQTNAMRRELTWGPGDSESVPAILGWIEPRTRCQDGEISEHKYSPHLNLPKNRFIIWSTFST